MAVPGQPLIERAWGYPVAMRQVTHALPVHPPEHAHLRRPRQRAESSSEPCPTVQSLEPVAFLLAHLEVGHLFRGLVVAAALHLDLGCGVLDLGEFIGRQLDVGGDVGGFEVLLQPLQLCACRG
jgi:hypothetical protein